MISDPSETAVQISQPDVNRTAAPGSVRGNWLEAGRVANWYLTMTKHCPFRYFKTSSEIIGLAVMLCVRVSLSPRNAEDLLHERGIDISHETGRWLANRAEKSHVPFPRRIWYVTWPVWIRIVAISWRSGTHGEGTVAT